MTFRQSVQPRRGLTPLADTMSGMTQDATQNKPATSHAAGTLITVAPTGAETAKGDCPQLPTTLAELVEAAVTCQAAGASLIHIHIRDAEHRPNRGAVLLRE